MPEKPTWTGPPYPNGHDAEPVSGVFEVKTGKTRRRTVKQGVALTAIIGLLTPLVYTLMERIARPGPLIVVVAGCPDGGP